MGGNNGNSGMQRLIDIVNGLQDDFSKLGIPFHVDLPQIAVIGAQSVGKSSVLESIVGRDFLPTGKQLVTRCPLLLHLIYDKDKECGEFLHKPGVIFDDFNEIRDEIENQTQIIDPEQKISETEITLTIRSPNVLNLTLIDLPGVTRVPIGPQPENIYEIIKALILKYISKENCLILAVSAANADLATSDGIQLARSVDPNGHRTIGVLTKLDLMDTGSDARLILDNKASPLRRGYIGVRSRSQFEIEKGVDVLKGREMEEKFFRNHPAYKDIADRLGTQYLQVYLNQELSKHISNALPDVRQQISGLHWNTEQELEKQPKKLKDDEKFLAMENLLLSFKEKLQQSLGRREGVHMSLEKMGHGALINRIMNCIYPAAIDGITNDENKLREETYFAVQNANGIYIGIYPPDIAIEAVIKNLIKRYLPPSNKCINDVCSELELAVKECSKLLELYPRLRGAVLKFVTEFIREARNAASAQLQYFVAIHCSYINTKHEDFIDITDPDQVKIEAESTYELPLTDELKEPAKEKKQIEYILVAVLNYIKIIKKIFKDHLPKLITHALVKETEYFLSTSLPKKLNDFGGESELMRQDPVVEETINELIIRKEAYQKAIDRIDEFNSI